MNFFRMMLAVIAVLALAVGLASATVLQSTFKDEIFKAPAENAIDGTTGMLDCTGAIEIPNAPGVYTYSRSTLGAASNADDYVCNPYPGNYAGGEIVLHSTFGDDVTWAASWTGDGCDVDCVVLAACEEDVEATCLGVFDTNVYISEPIPVELFFVVEGYNGYECDFEFTITVSEYIPPEAVDFCDLVQDVYGETFTGNTCDGPNNIATGFDCQDYPEHGLEHYYEIFMPAGSSFTADVSENGADRALWVLDGCAEPFVCLGYADATVGGDPEVVSYTNDTGTDMNVILVIDSWGTDSCGTYALTFTSQGGAIATEIESFGNVKAMFR